MGIASKILENVNKLDEALSSNDRINVELFDDLMVSLGYNCEIYKKRKSMVSDDGEEFEEFEDLELQAQIKSLIKPDADMFIRSVTAKLVALQNTQG